MIPFLIVLLSALLGFTISYRKLINHDDESVNFIDCLKHNYRIIYGDFNTDNYTASLWVLFVLSSTLLSLIMLNMLIAIMSDTFGRVMSLIVPEDFYEMNDIILE